MAKTKTNKLSKKEVSSAQSMLNNLKTVPDNRYGAQEAKFYITRLKQQTGRSEQSLMSELVICGFNACPSFASIASGIKAEWDKINQKL